MKPKRDSHVSNIVSIPEKSKTTCTDQSEKEKIGTKEIRSKNQIMYPNRKRIGISSLYFIGRFTTVQNKLKIPILVF